MIRKLAAYVILGINMDGMKEVLSIEVGDNESSKYWLSVLNSLKNRGVKDILIICADDLTGIKDAVTTAPPLSLPVTIMMSIYVIFIDITFFFSGSSNTKGWVIIHPLLCTCGLCFC